MMAPRAGSNILPCSRDSPKTRANPCSQAALGEITGEACAHGQQCILQRKTWETAAASSYVGLTLIKWVTR